MRPPSAIWAILTTAALGGQQTPPTFNAGVNLVTIDVQTTPVKGERMRDLTVADFDITISGRKRPAASVTLLHFDDGTVLREIIRRPPAECVFGFYRKADRVTAHYLIGVQATAADGKEVKQVRVGTMEKVFDVQWYLWRSPILKSAS
jgi:hypothetical protein